MQLDNMEEVKRLLQDIENLFMNLDDYKKELEDQISTKEAEQEDYLHELELGNLNGIEIMRTSKSLIKTRKERRILKDKLDLIKTLKGYVDEYIKKGIVAQTKQAITNIDTLKSNLESKEYTPKVVKELKCAKKLKDRKIEEVK